MIRPARPEDISSILEIYNEAVINTTASYQYKPDTLEEKIVWYYKKASEGYPVLVFEYCGSVVAFASYGPFRSADAYQYTIENSVYVKKDLRRKNIGTMLMKELINIANEKGYATMVAGIDAGNEGSIILHEKLGFIYCGTIKKAGYKFNTWLDLVFYQYNLKGPKILT